MTVLPALSTASDAGSEGEFRALEILHALFTGDVDAAGAEDDVDVPLSSSGVKLLMAGRL